MNIILAIVLVAVNVGVAIYSLLRFWTHLNAWNIENEEDEAFRVFFRHLTGYTIEMIKVWLLNVLLNVILVGAITVSTVYSGYQTQKEVEEETLYGTMSYYSQLAEQGYYD